MAEPTPERLREKMDRLGYTEQEARVAIHLEEAETLLRELTKESNIRSELGRIIWAETHTREHFRSLHRELAMLVLRRDYPNGWGYVPPRDDDESDE